VKLVQRAAIVFTVVTGAVVAFQIALALGAPWGEYAMGGAYPGVLPPAMCVAAMIQGALLVGTALVALSRSGLILASWARASARLIWLIVALGSVSLVLDVMTLNAAERLIWTPVAAVLLACIVTVAVGVRMSESRQA
jgi:hypothetical protein